MKKNGLRNTKNPIADPLHAWLSMESPKNTSLAISTLDRATTFSTRASNTYKIASLPLDLFDDLPGPALFDMEDLVMRFPNILI